ncbi:sigma-54 dependent transcriptional regulator [Luminiphilus sp.]|nr:sigma-54 dependent transcriptional regulator [Luminiphilus sp.]
MNQPAKVLVVEDDATLRQALCDTIKFGGYEAVEASSGVDALGKLSNHGVDMVISDVQMDHMDGRELLRKVRVTNPELPFVIITAHGSVEGAVDAMREGATDYLLKPFEAEVLLDMVSRMEPLRKARAGDVIMADPETAKVYALAQKVASNDASILISGESGCGKEVLAQYLHSHSTRVDQPFVAVNCAAIPENMLESMLFGYEKGAYTGAHQARAGKFEQANHGTILLDEVSEMPLALQAKLLRVLQERELERLGGDKVIDLDVRVIATTNRNLVEEVAEGRFREDLYYRLNVFPLHLAPLRERRADILPLAELFLSKYQPADRPLKLDIPAAEKIRRATWQGNVRELENCIQRAVILSQPDGLVREEDVVITEPLLSVEPAHAEAQVEDPQARLDGDLKQREHELICEALEASGGKKKEAAERLGISPRTLRYKLARLRECGVALPA